ncbi:MAG: hypothetical protein QN152_02575 [Armatimonadota bacterium]|nr:hypothetical protein [Armatimonadota bacterium]MDR7428081.1 hypothetical protein [Armatimonadota bacterium]MDR7464585.1 hypothetical protein [Armatimonadota bacterium]MDR7469683.1 hypothetical protein [Armatimonadota bacterium]MDR7475895.1 hypothetical protein [Armatimonadota bacterium]
MGADPRVRELRVRRHRRRKIAMLLARLQKAQGRDEREKLVGKMIKLAPWRAAEFRRFLG